MVGHSSGSLAIDRCFLYDGDAGRGSPHPRGQRRWAWQLLIKNTKGVPASQVGGGGR